MKVIYTDEQKHIAIQTYKKLKSYAKTLRVLSYPSRHILFDWVNNSQKRGRPTKKSTIKAKKYSFDLKLKAVTRSLEGVNVKQIASELDITTHAIIYDWLKKYRMEGEEGLMSKREKIAKGIYKTKAQLINDLPDDVEELKKLTAKLMVEKAILEKELEFSKKLEGGIPNKLSNKLKVEIILALVDVFPLPMLLEELDLKRSSFYYAKLSLSKPDKYHHIRSLIHKISESSFYTYGSPRIWFSLIRRGITQAILVRLHQHVKTR